MNSLDSRITFRFEDRYGTYSLFNNILGKILQNNPNIKILNGLSRESYCGINKHIITMERTKYMVAVFDCDPINDTFDMIKWGHIMEHFRELNKRSELKANIEYVNRENYIGNKVVLLPVFFCFESLYLLDEELYKIFSIISASVNKYNRPDTLYLHNTVPEVFLNYNEYKACSTDKKSIQYLYTNTSKYVIQELLKPYKEDINVKNFLAEHEVSMDDLYTKNENLLFELLERSNIYDIKLIVKQMFLKSIFNYEFVQLLKCKSIKEIEEYLDTITFEKYKDTLKRKLDVYQHIVENGLRNTKSINLLCELCKDLRKDNFHELVRNHLYENIDVCNRGSIS